jgi:uncharacterized membrane protein YhhN
LIAISVLCALAYLVKYRLSPPSRTRTLVKSTSAGALALSTSFGAGPVALIFFFATAGVADAFLAREDEYGFYAAMATALLSQIFLCLSLFSAWTGIDAPLIAVLGLSGIWVGYFMLIWGALERMRLIIVCYSVGTLVATYLALGSTTYGQFAVVGMLFYVLSQIFMSLEFFVLQPYSLEVRLGGHAIWLFYYMSLLLFFAAFHCSYVA